MAAAVGHAPSTIHRIWKAFGLQPHRPSRATCRRRSRRCRVIRRCRASRSPTRGRGCAGRRVRRCRSPGGTGCRARGRGCSCRARGRETARPRARGRAAASGPASRSRRRSSPQRSCRTSRPDHHHIKVGIGRRLFIGAADEAPEDIEREGRPLDIRLARRKPLAGRRKLGQGHCAHLRYQGYVYDSRADEAQGAGRFPFKKNTARRFEIDIHLPATAAEQDWPLKSDRPHQRRVTRT